MRRLSIATGLLTATACIQFPSEDAAVHAALEYELDRAKVLGVSMEPPYFVSGMDTRISALVLGPDGEASAITAAVCGLRTDVTVDVEGVDCFDEEELVEPLLDSVPGTWTTPDLTQVGCAEDTNIWDDTGVIDTAALMDPEFLGERTPYSWRRCYSDVPMLLEAQVGDETAYAYVPLRLLHHPLTDLEEQVVGDHIVDRELTLTVSGTPRAGASVELAASLPSLLDEPTLVFRWSVDAGELRATSRTLNHVRSEGVTTSYNTLTIPEDHQGDLRVAVVVSRQVAEEAGDEIWTVRTLEVP